MHDMEAIRRIARLDLNLLTVFLAMAETRHVTRAAKAMGLSQPALSHALRRLRETLGDALFVKTTKGMAMTPFAEAIAPSVREILGRLESEVLRRTPFSPETITRTWRIRSTDFLETLLAPPLLAAFAAESPRSRVALRPLAYDLPREELEDGTCDLAIAGFFGDLPDGFHRQFLFKDSFLCAVRRDHPRLGGKRKIGIAEYCAENHILYSPSGDLSGTVDAALRKAKAKREVTCGVSGFTVASWIAASTDGVFTAPARLLRQSATYLPLTLFTPPMPLADIRIAQVWHDRNHGDPAHKWFRSRVAALLAEANP